MSFGDACFNLDPAGRPRERRHKTSYNFLILRSSASIVTGLVFLVAFAAPQPSCAQQVEPAHARQMLLIMPFENTSSIPVVDWIGESFPEVLGNRLSSSSM